jgi:5-methylcytosine-specific restriction enzyme A
MPSHRCPAPLCGALLPKPGYCNAHRRERSSTRRDPRRQTRRWKLLARDVIDSQGGACATPGCMHLATDCDHIEATDTGGAFWERSNLQGLCRSCHSRKTVAEMHAR